MAEIKAFSAIMALTNCQEQYIFSNAQKPVPKRLYRAIWESRPFSLQTT
jgi:hypothetical protein